MPKWFFGRSKVYRCKNCGYKLPKEEAVISGLTSENSLGHIHCPKCGEIIKNL